MARMSSDSVGSGAGKCEPGDYHLIVNACEEHTAKTGNEGFKVEVEVLGGTVAGQETKKVKSFLYAPSLWDFAAAVGLKNHITGEPFTPAMLAEMRDPANKGKKIEVEFRAEDAVGCQFFGNVVPELDEHKKVKPDGWPRLGMKLLSVLDEKAKDIPRNQDMIDELLGITAGSGESGGSARD